MFRLVGNSQLARTHRFAVGDAVIRIIKSHRIAVRSGYIERDGIRTVAEAGPLRSGHRQPVGFLAEPVLGHGEIQPAHRQLLRHGEIHGRDTSRLKRLVQLHADALRLITVRVIGRKDHRAIHRHGRQEEPYVASIRVILRRFGQRPGQPGHHRTPVERQHRLRIGIGQIEGHRADHIAGELHPQPGHIGPQPVAADRHLHPHDMTLVNKLERRHLRRGHRAARHGTGNHQIAPRLTAGRRRITAVLLGRQRIGHLRTRHLIGNRISSVICIGFRRHGGHVGRKEGLVRIDPVAVENRSGRLFLGSGRPPPDADRIALRPKCTVERIATDGGTGPPLAGLHGANIRRPARRNVSRSGRIISHTAT